ncbi:hypothetical protein ISP17_02625 [Dyella ginsengisoli]|uniref:HTH merR-type domain-containing protein n=1 Tax=Dyella ginsengisoli TaxID=363848 RepID=A0ABW8JRD5_9GAMM
MAGIHYTAVHVRELLGLSRTDLQRWLSALPPFNQVKAKPRTARQFTIADLAFFRAVAELHQRLGLSLHSIAAFSAPLRARLDMRAALTGGTVRLYINQVGDGAWAVGSEAQGALSVALDLEPIWLAVYAFVGVAMPAQRELALGLVSLSGSSHQEDRRGRQAR